MIKEKTLLVLGAGASADLGYPTGEALVEYIKTSSEKMADMGASSFREINKNLSYFMPLSIDEHMGYYKEINPNYVDDCKHLIAYSILEIERKCDLYRAKSHGASPVDVALPKSLCMIRNEDKEARTLSVKV